MFHLTATATNRSGETVDTLSTPIEAPTPEAAVRRGTALAEQWDPEYCGTIYLLAWTIADAAGTVLGSGTTYLDVL